MAVTVKGTPTSAAATSVALPAHAVGDLIVIFAFRDGSTTVPTKPTAGSTVPSWVDIDANTGGATCSSRTAYFVATATNHTSGTWTGATGMVAVVLQGQGARPIGGHVESGGSSSTSATAPALVSSTSGVGSSQWTTDGTAAVLEFFGHRNVTAWGTAPTGYTRQTSVATEVCCNTKNDTTVIPGATAQTATISANGGYRGATIEILPVAQKAEMLKDEFVTKDTTKFDWSANTSVISGSAEMDVIVANQQEWFLTKALYDLTGSSISFKVSGINIAGTSAYAGLFIYDPITDPTLLTYEEMWADQTNSLKIDEVVAGVADAGAVVINPYSTTNFAWWRVRESGGTIFWDTATDGGAWVNRRSKTVGAINLSQVLIQWAVYSNDATTALFAIDHLNPPLGKLAAALKKATASLAGVAGAETGTIAVTTKKVTANFSGTQRYIGTMAPTIRKTSASISGVEYPQGSIAASVKKLTASLSATQRYIGSVAVTLKPVTASFSGYMRPAGSITATLKKATFSASGLEKYIGTIAVTQKKLTASFTGQQYYSGAIAATIKKLTSSLVGYEQPVGSIVSTVKKVQFSSVGAVAAVVGAISASLKHPTASLSGKEFPRGSIAVTAKKPTASLSGVQKYVGTSAVTLKKLTANLSGIQRQTGTIAATVKKNQFSGSGSLGYFGVIAVTNKKATFSGHGGPLILETGTIAVSLKKTVFTGIGHLYGPARSGALVANRGFRLMKTASGRLVKFG